MNLDDTYYLPRASRYTNPLNGNARLPLPYGDLTDGSNGIWELPCIDTVNHVYAFAGAAVLSVANGNSVTIYADGVEVNGANYTFDESDDYESQGAIATVTFTSTQGNSSITARGKGKDDGGGSLMENGIDIVFDFCTVENDLAAADFLGSAKAAASAVCTAQGYKAAGVIAQDVQGWDLLQKMMGSFLGSVFYNSDKKLVLEIDDGTLRYSSMVVVERTDIETVSAVQRLDNLVNQCPCNYGYNYATAGFAHHTDDTADADAASQGIFGVRKPSTPYQFYWCRDSTSVDTVQAIIIDKFARPVWEIEITDRTMKRANIEPGDLIAATIEQIYDSTGAAYVNQLLRVVGERPAFQGGKMTLRTIDTGAFLTLAYLADGSIIADGSAKAGNDRDTTIY